MEEEMLFERIHAALEVQPPAGAYERLRVALNQRPVKPSVVDDAARPEPQARELRVPVL